MLAFKGAAELHQKTKVEIVSFLTQIRHQLLKEARTALHYVTKPGPAGQCGKKREGHLGSKDYSVQDHGPWKQPASLSYGTELPEGQYQAWHMGRLVVVKIIIIAVTIL